VPSPHHHHHHDHRRGIGFVTYASADSVEKIMATKHWLNGHEIAIDRATPKEEGMGGMQGMMMGGTSVGAGMGIPPMGPGGSGGGMGNGPGGGGMGGGRVGGGAGGVPMQTSAQAIASMLFARPPPAGPGMGPGTSRRSFDNGANIIGPGLLNVGGMHQHNNGAMGHYNMGGQGHAGGYDGLRSLSEDREEVEAMAHQVGRQGRQCARHPC
jgi:hypothetical protein